MAQSTPLAKKTPAKKPVLAKKTATNAAVSKSKKIPTSSEDERYNLINETAYLMAEKRGFQGNQAMDDWLQAEMEVNARFAAKH